MSNYEKQLLEIINQDEFIIEVIEAVEQLQLNDAWVCAGLIRNKVWDVLHNTDTEINDIDVIYFDDSDATWETEKQLERKLMEILPTQLWSVKNQARMHLKSGFSPFKSSYDGVASFPETPTAVAIRKNGMNIEIMAPYGLQDLFEMRVSPTALYFKGIARHSVYIDRMKNKNWQITWEHLSIEY